jgi:hypothetical protein
MPDTSASRAAIHLAYDKRRNVNGGLSTAELKLQAAGGLIRDDGPLTWPEDSPIWFEHALDGLQSALSSCDALKDAVRAAITATEQDQARAKTETKENGQ